MTNPDLVQVAYNVIEDAMTPAAYDSHHGGYWLSDLPPDLLAQRIVTALRDHLLTSEDTCRRLTHARMSYYGYTTEQIAAAEQPRQHTDACERTEQGWHCYDEHDRTPHPLQDTLDEATEQIRWVLDQIDTMLGGPNA